MPSDDDLILCLTWGQFIGEGKYTKYVAKHFDADYPGYFGRRADIPRPYKKDNDAIEESFRVGNIVYRQGTFCFPETSTLFASWLRTAPEDIVAATYPVGEVDPAAYPSDKWTDLY